MLSSLRNILLDQRMNRALDRLAAIMDNGKPYDQIRAAALTIDTMLRLHRIADRQSRRARQVARNEVCCLLVEEKAEKSRKKQSVEASNAA